MCHIKVCRLASLAYMRRSVGSSGICFASLANTRASVAGDEKPINVVVGAKQSFAPVLGYAKPAKRRFSSGKLPFAASFSALNRRISVVQKLYRFKLDAEPIDALKAHGMEHIRTHEHTMRA